MIMLVFAALQLHSHNLLETLSVWKYSNREMWWNLHLNCFISCSKSYMHWTSCRVRYIGQIFVWNLQHNLTRAVLVIIIEQSLLHLTPWDCSKVQSSKMNADCVPSLFRLKFGCCCNCTYLDAIHIFSCLSVCICTIDQSTGAASRVSSLYSGKDLCS